MAHQKVGFGLIPSAPDERPYGVSGTSISPAPGSDYHLSPHVHRGWDQRWTNTCVWWAYRGALHLLRSSLGIEAPDISVLAGYYATLMRTHSGNRERILDFGCKPPQAALIMNEVGYIPERLWPFSPDAVCQEPDWKALVASTNPWFILRRVLAPHGKRQETIKHLIHNKNRPVLIGHAVDDPYVDWRPGDPPWRFPFGGKLAGHHMELVATYCEAGAYTVSSWGDTFDRLVDWMHVESDNVPELWYVDVEIVETTRLARSS